MKEQNSRTEMLIGEDGVEKLKNSHVAVFGVGGVGGYAVEALVRAGVGSIDLIDSDEVSISNINRQIIATHKTVGMYKTEAMRDRILSINPDAQVVCHNLFFDEGTKDKFDFSKYDYVVDAIDSLSAKVELIASVSAAGTRIISAMGAGNKLDPTRFEVSDISKTTVCPLARAVRIALRKRGINHLKVVYSKEPPVIPPEVSDGIKKRVPGSISFVPSAMGLIIAGEVIKDIVIGEKPKFDN
ncbi:MAG: tRNA threonylcarbamoyladenosine dehydratase [Clostridia bacterium]|nr:tRNA threonylcarbamoyladenosine dehydratase [Clostridia bacterium]